MPTADEATPFQLRREELRLRQADVANQAGLPRSVINELESGNRRDIGGRKLYAVAKVLGVRMETLLDVPALGQQPLHVLDPKSPSGSALMQAWQRYGWIEEDVAALALLDFRGRQPETPEGWWFIYEAIRRTVLSEAARP